eukprot:2227902-Alexandrium_andersonii.AAC.1
MGPVPPRAGPGKAASLDERKVYGHELVANVGADVEPFRPRGHGLEEADLPAHGVEKVAPRHGADDVVDVRDHIPEDLLGPRERGLVAPHGE